MDNGYRQKEELSESELAAYEEFERAIKKAGGVSALARRLEVGQSRIAMAKLRKKVSGELAVKISRQRLGRITILCPD